MKYKYKMGNPINYDLDPSSSDNESNNESDNESNNESNNGPNNEPDNDESSLLKIKTAF